MDEHKAGWVGEFVLVLLFVTIAILAAVTVLDYVDRATL
jgi:hypothetical protein